MRRAMLGLLCLVLTLAGCTTRVPAAATPTPLPQSAPAPEPATPAAVVVQAVAPAPLPAVAAARPIASPSPASLPLSLLAGRSGSDLRVALDSLLAEDAFLSVTAMQASAAARLDELIGVSSQLDSNTLTLAEIVGAVRGQAAADAFAATWRAHTGDLLSYAQGQRASAGAHLDARRAATAAQLTTGALSVADAQAALQRRDQAELAVVDSADAARALGALLESSDELARPLAAVMAAQQSDLSPRTTEGAEVDLRVRVVGALQAHLLLTGAAVAAAADGRSAEAKSYVDVAGIAADHFGSALAALSPADSTSLGAAVAERLRGRTAALVSAASGGDRAQAAQDIEHVRGELDALLSGANALLPPGLLAQQLRASDQPLLIATDAFVSRDQPTAFARLHEAMHQAQKPADTLAEAIVDRYPGKYLVVPPPAPETSAP